MKIKTTYDDRIREEEHNYLFLVSFLIENVWDSENFCELNSSRKNSHKCHNSFRLQQREEKIKTAKPFIFLLNILCVWDSPFSSPYTTFLLSCFRNKLLLNLCNLSFHQVAFSIFEQREFNLYDKNLFSFFFIRDEKMKNFYLQLQFNKLKHVNTKFMFSR